MSSKLLIAIPNYGNNAPGLFLDSMVRLMTHLARKFGPGEIDYMRVGLMYIDIARNMIWDEARRRQTEALLCLDDDMTFTPSVIEVREGDTVRLRLKNRGHELHELVLGTTAEIEAHAALMKKHPEMEHDEPWMAHVQPGKTGEVVWRFNRAGDFDFACLVKDHYELGMAGRVRVLAAAARKP